MIPDDYECDGQMSFDQFIENTTDTIDAIICDDSKRFAVCFEKEESESRTRKEMKSEEGYNGWSNYETWCLSLWINNDQAYCSDFDESASKILKKNHGDRKAAESELANFIKLYFEESNPVNTASVFSDLLDHSLSRVDYREIARSMLSID